MEQTLLYFKVVCLVDFLLFVATKAAERVYAPLEALHWKTLVQSVKHPR